MILLAAHARMEIPQYRKSVGITVDAVVYYYVTDAKAVKYDQSRLINVLGLGEELKAMNNKS